MSFTRFWQRNLACAKLAIHQQLEYRFNFFIDAFVQPSITAMIEMAIWFSVVKAMSGQTLAGFSADDYLIYALWGTFFARQMGTWTYDLMMISEIQMGTLNASLTRPLSFFEYHFFQFLGHRLIGFLFSIGIPIAVTLYIRPELDFAKLPLALGVGFGYLVFAFLLSFLVVCSAFFLTRVNSMIFAKNIALWILTGEIFPLDLLPANIAPIAKVLPFASGVYLPVGYLCGRVNLETLQNGVVGLFAGLIAMASVCYLVWTTGLKKYSGVGA